MLEKLPHLSVRYSLHYILKATETHNSFTRFSMAQLQALKKNELNFARAANKPQRTDLCYVLPHPTNRTSTSRLVTFLPIK